MNRGGVKGSEFQIEVNNQEDWEDLMSRDGLKVIDVYQEWSGPCQSVKNLFKRIKEEQEDDNLFFAIANAESIDSLERYRGRSEPYFLLYGGQSLVAVVKGANCPNINQVIFDMLKQEHDVMAGEIVRVEIEDTFLKIIEEEKAAEAKRIARQKEIDQECVPLIFHKEIEEETSGSIIQMLTNFGFEIMGEATLQLSDDLVIELIANETEDPDYGARLGDLTKVPLKCVLLSKGPEGVVEEIKKYLGPASSEKEAADGEVIECIRDKFGDGSPKCCVTVPGSVSLSSIIVKAIFPEFTPPRVITYLEEEEAKEGPTAADLLLEDLAQGSHDSDADSGVPEYDGPPRVLVLVKPPAYEIYRGDVIADLEIAGFTILSTKDHIFTEEEARTYFKDMATLSNFDDFITEVISGTCHIIVACKKHAFKGIKELLGFESYARNVQEASDSLRGRYSSLPDVEKENDFTWIDATLSELTAPKTISYFFPLEDTFAMLKPETHQVRDEILDEIKKNGFKIVAKKEVELLPEDIRIIYQSNIDKSYYDDIVRQMTSGPLLVLALRAQDAVQKWRKLMGPTDPDAAVDEYPIDLRATYGKTILDNAVHGSETVENAQISIHQIFGDLLDKKDTYCCEGDDCCVTDEDGSEEGEEEGEGKRRRCKPRCKDADAEEEELEAEATEEAHNEISTSNSNQDIFNETVKTKHKKSMDQITQRQPLALKNRRVIR